MEGEEGCAGVDWLWGGEGLLGLFVYAGEFIEAEDGEGDGRDQHEEGHVCGYG